jgi:rhamnulokinase
MPAAIQAYCRDTRQTVPDSKGEIVRTALEGLALKYRWVVDKLEILLNRKFNALHVVGGGSQNKLLCQFAADATGLPVIAGPVEATAIGNIAVQAVATGHLASLDEARQVIRRSFGVVTYEPAESAPWDEAYERFEKLVS